MPDIKSNHVQMMRRLADALNANNADRFNHYLSVAEKCVKDDVSIAEAVRETERLFVLPVSAKTMVNELTAAVRLADHYGGFKRYDKAVDDHNDKMVASGKKQTFSHQSFLTTFGLVKSSKTAAKKAPGKKSATLNDAVQKGIITKAQAAALRKMGF